MTPAARPTLDAPPTRTAGSRKESPAGGAARAAPPSPGRETNGEWGPASPLEALTRAAEGTYQDVPLDALQPNLPSSPASSSTASPWRSWRAAWPRRGKLEPAIARRVRREGVETLEIAPAPGAWLGPPASATPRSALSPPCGWTCVS